MTLVMEYMPMGGFSAVPSHRIRVRVRIRVGFRTLDDVQKVLTLLVPSRRVRVRVRVRARVRVRVSPSTSVICFPRAENGVHFPTPCLYD